jgi:hypothetical protein
MGEIDRHPQCPQALVGTAATLPILASWKQPNFGAVESELHADAGVIACVDACVGTVRG